MAKEHSHSPETDLDKTDELPILKDIVFDLDVEEEAAPLDRTAVLQGPPLRGPGGAAEFARPPGVDLPSLAETVRSVEERFSRQYAEHEALNRAYERARDAEAASVARANALAVDLAAARAALESEQVRSRELERAMADRAAAAEAARSRVEEALRESERYQSESRTLRDSLAARDASIAKVLHSLGERDAQLSALRAEHAKIVPALEATSISTSQLEAELQASRAQATAVRADLQTALETVAALNAQVKLGESQVNEVRSELGAAKIQATSYLELLQTREWRGGFEQNLFREMDAQVGAAHAGHGALESERARLQSHVVDLESQLAALSAAAELRQAETTTQAAQLRVEQAAQIERLRSEAETHEQEMAVLMAHLKEARRPIQSIEADIKRLTEELSAKTAACAALDEENRNLRATLERTRGALEEREFLIRRLERSESNNANVLGRIQTSIERLGSAPVGPTAGAAQAPAADWSAELIRIDGERPVTHVLSRRTRIGRATGCELQIESGSVSRHHALVMVGPRVAVIEDLNSTNGVFVNGRKVTRQTLSDGDAISIGDTQFRYLARPLHPTPAPNPVEPTPST